MAHTGAGAQGSGFSQGALQGAQGAGVTGAQGAGVAGAQAGGAATLAHAGAPTVSAWLLHLHGWQLQSGQYP